MPTKLVLRNRLFYEDHSDNAISLVIEIYRNNYLYRRLLEKYQADSESEFTCLKIFIIESASGLLELQYTRIRPFGA